MGGIIVPNTKISGAMATPGIPLADSPTSGLYETQNGGIGMSLSGEGFFELNRLSFLLGYKPAQALSINQVTGSPFAGDSASVYQAAISPDGAHVIVIPNGASNSLSVYSLNAITGALTAVAGSPFATGVAHSAVAISPDGAHVIVANNAANSLSVYSLNALTGALTAVAGSPFATGVSPLALAISPDGAHVIVGNNNINGLSVYSLDTTTGALVAVAGSPFATGSGSYSVAVSPDGNNIIFANIGLNSLNVFQFYNNPTVNLISALFDPTGQFGGGININGRLQVKGTDILSETFADARYAALAGLITQAFSAKQLTLDHAAGGLIGTTAADNAIVGTVGEYIESIVLLAAAVNLATGVTANVTSINLTAGDWDLDGVISFHGDGTTNINDVQVGTNNAAAAFGGVGTYQSDYLTIVVAAGIDATYIAPKHRFSLAAPATVYLVALAHFTISTCTAYGKISARRVR